MSSLRVIVTRPARDARYWVQQLCDGGVQAEALPLIDIAPAQDAEALERSWQTLENYAACMFVSGNAVEHFFSAGSSARVNALPAGMRFMAPGPGTVAALLAAGVPLAQIDAPAANAPQFDSEALWRVVGQRDWRASRVLIVRGESRSGPNGGAATPGRDWIARQWLGAGAQVDFVGVYQRRIPVLDTEQLARAKQASSDGSVWLFSSSEAVANLLSQPGLDSTVWQRARAIATHSRIEEATRTAGWGVVVASRPALGDIRAALASIESLDT